MYLAVILYTLLDTFKLKYLMISYIAYMKLKT